jgi:hypothetical protein
MPQIRTVNITRYITPLREGGSLPAIVEADDGFMYALKFRGAGQGTKALIHNPEAWEEQAVKPFVQIKDHVLLSKANDLEQVKDKVKFLISKEFLEEIVNLIPENWIPDTETADKKMYLSFLLKRLENSEIFETQIENARKALI